MVERVRAQDLDVIVEPRNGEEASTRPVKIRSHTDLEVWHRAVDFAVEIYRATESMPKSELYGLTSQIRRSSASIAANIAEGSSRRTSCDLLHFLVIANGSLRETETFLEIIQRLGLSVEVVPLQQRAGEVGKLLAGLLRSIGQRV